MSIVTTKPRTRPSLSASPERIITSVTEDTRLAHADQAEPVHADQAELAPLDRAEPAEEAMSATKPVRGGSRTRTARLDMRSDPAHAYRRLVDVEARRVAAKTEKLAGPVADLASILDMARGAGMTGAQLRQILESVGTDVDELRRMADELDKRLV